jgi:hypothetical protein
VKLWLTIYLCLLAMDTPINITSTDPFDHNDPFVLR